MARTVAIFAALDTKGDEARLIRDVLADQGVTPLVVDIGVLDEPGFRADVNRQEVAAAGGAELVALVESRDKSRAMDVMTAGAAVVAGRLYAEGKIHGIIGIGGSAGTGIATSAMRALPVGVPKLCVSTVAAGETRPYVGTKDVTLMYSVVDVAGINRISARILTNAAAAVAGMVKVDPPAIVERPLLAASMFGNTTRCVDRARKLLEEAGYEVLVFHATGAGGQTMESLISDGFISGVFDVTTTEWADELCGGVFNAGPHRLEAAARSGVPQVIAPGCLDMVNFGAPETVPERYRGRNHYRWNPNVTLLRTNPEENSQLGQIIAEKVNASIGPAAVLLPLKGVSQLDSEGGAFWWPEADAALFNAIKQHVRDGIPVYELDYNVNDPEFADAAAKTLLELMGAEIMRYSRKQVLERLRAQTAVGRPIVGAGAGTGISAKFAEVGGADLIIIYNSGRYRMAGHGSLAGILAFGDANQIVKEMGEREVLPVVKTTPVIAGVMGTDPLRQMDYLLREIDALGFSGINNFPTVGLIDGRFRMELERTNLGFSREVDLIRLAHDLGFFTVPYVFNPDEARAMAEVGADSVIAHMGLTVGGSIGLDRGDAMSLERAPAAVQAIGEAAWNVRKDVILLCHGGPIATPEDAAYVLERSDAIGFVGASSMERLPVETALAETTRRFKLVKLRTRSS